MKKLGVITCLSIITLLFISCSSKKKEDKEGLSTQVISREEYNPDIDKEQVYSSLIEFEKLLFAPLYYFEKKDRIKSFSQNMKYQVTSKVDDEERELMLEETISYSKGDKDSFKIAYKNSHNEGLEIIWMNNFLFRKVMGGKYNRSFSMGEHDYYKETFFSVIPDIYAVFRDHASIDRKEDSIYKNKAVTKILVNFSNDRKELPDREKKKYMQNIHGLEEMKNDQLIEMFRTKDKSHIKGSLEVFVSPNHDVIKTVINISFTVVENGVTFTISGDRELFEKPIDTFVQPFYTEEYHRRTMDAAKNIMQGDKK